VIKLLVSRILAANLTMFGTALKRYLCFRSTWYPLFP